MSKTGGTKRDYPYRICAGEGFGTFRFRSRVPFRRWTRGSSTLGSNNVEPQCRDDTGLFFIKEIFLNKLIFLLKNVIYKLGKALTYKIGGCYAQVYSASKI